MRHLIHFEEAEGAQVVDILFAGTMDVAANRNRIVREFLNSSATWLYWWDSDNTTRPGSIARLLSAVIGTDRTMIGGLYYLKHGKPWPVAYNRLDDGRYEAIYNWEPGEIIRADAMGMNSLLTHRKVYEDIDEQFVPLLRDGGGLLSVHRDDIEGDVLDNMRTPKDGKVVDGLYHTRLRRPPTPFSTQFFMMGFNRTEDMDFFEKARRCGHQLWVDTSVESGHLMEKAVGGVDYRKMKKEGVMTRDEFRADNLFK